MKSIKSLCVFCGSNEGRDSNFAAQTRDLAKAMAERSIRLVYGGANVGLMKQLADTCLGFGGEVIGVMTSFLVDKEIAHPNLSRLEIVASMSSRKERMAQLADGFILLPGGLGSLDEFFEVWTGAQLGLINKPLAILNTNDYYSSLIAFLQQSQKQGFVHQSHIRNLIIETEVVALLESLMRHPEPMQSKWNL